MERGRLDGIRVGSLRRVAEELEIRIVIDARWRGGELDRLLNARHSALHESLARHLSGLHGWIFEPEVSFAYYRDRGIVDILAWHAGRRALLLIELKTELVDIQEAVGTFDVKLRVAGRIARDRGWFPEVIGGWLVIADSTTNRRRAAAHTAMLRAAFPADGHAIRSWLRSPDGSIRALSFWSEAQSIAAKRRAAPRQRVQRPRAGHGSCSGRAALQAASNGGAG